MGGAAQGILQGWDLLEGVGIPLSKGNILGGGWAWGQAPGPGGELQVGAPAGICTPLSPAGSSLLRCQTTWLRIPRAQTQSPPPSGRSWITRCRCCPVLRGTGLSQGGMGAAMPCFSRTEALRPWGQKKEWGAGRVSGLFEPWHLPDCVPSRTCDPCAHPAENQSLLWGGPGL